MLQSALQALGIILPVDNNLPAALYSFKSLKCMLSATDHQSNDLFKNGTSKTEQREWPTNKLYA